MGKGSDVATTMNTLKELMANFPLYINGQKTRTNEVLTSVDRSVDGAKLVATKLQGVSQDISDHMGMLAQFVDSDSATWSGWQQAQHEVDSQTLTAFAQAVPALEKLHQLLMAVNEAIDEASSILAAADQVAEGAVSACNALIPL